MSSLLTTLNLSTTETIPATDNPESTATQPKPITRYCVRCGTSRIVHLDADVVECNASGAGASFFRNGQLVAHFASVDNITSMDKT